MIKGSDPRPEKPFAHPLTRQQRESVASLAEQHGTSYRAMRLLVSGAPSGSLCDYASLILGGTFYAIERDGHIHT